MIQVTFRNQEQWATIRGRKVRIGGETSGHETGGPSWHCERCTDDNPCSKCSGRRQSERDRINTRIKNSKSVIQHATESGDAGSREAIAAYRQAMERDKAALAAIPKR